MKNDFALLAAECAAREIVKKIVFSRPKSGEIAKVSGRVVAHRGRRMLALEYALPGNTVSQKNVPEAEIEGEILALLGTFMQADLLTTAGDAEYKISGKGKEALLGADKLRAKMRGEAQNFERAIESLDRKKNYILDGAEDFLIRLGVSDTHGRVHDKKQGKFRQINKFLEYLEEIYPELPADGSLSVYDLCCGKSYLTFAAYHYFVKIKGREVSMLAMDLKRDVILFCEETAKALGYAGMHFLVGDIRTLAPERAPDLVISLHACDIATDIVLDTAIALRAKAILSTPCCHHYLDSRIAAKELSFVTDYPKLRGKLCEAITDALRLARLRAAGYEVSATELVDPEDTPKNTLLRAILRGEPTDAAMGEYEAILAFLLGDKAQNYLKDL